MLKNNPTLTALILAITAAASAQAQTSARPEILTLFTTPQERDLIDRNRYRVTSPKADTSVKAAAPVEQKKILMQDVVLNIKLNGVSLDQSGQGIAWLNGNAYENGAKLEDGSKVYISGTLNAKVQIKTPDGKYHSLVTGEEREIKYSKAIEG
jgi:hypothetical protein